MFEHDYNLVGKHATYTKFLTRERTEKKEDTEKPYIFERYIDVYMNAAILGFLNGRQAPKDTTSTDRARIYADAFATERVNCEFIYRLIMLLDNSTGLSDEDRVNRAFRDDAKGEETEKLKANMELFHSYVLGGIEFLYEQFVEHATTRDDYITKAFEFISSFKDEIEGKPYEDRIQEVMNSYIAG